MTNESYRVVYENKNVMILWPLNPVSLFQKLKVINEAHFTNIKTSGYLDVTQIEQSLTETLL